MIGSTFFWVLKFSQFCVGLDMVGLCSQADFMRQAFQKDGAGKHLDLEAMLGKISQQIDAEIKLLDHGEGSALAAALSENSAATWSAEDVFSRVFQPQVKVIGCQTEGN